MALDAVQLSSRALIGIKKTPIASFDEGTAESQIASTLFPTIRDAVLSSYPWSFATTSRTLSRLVAVPAMDYDYAYQLPNNFLRVVSAGEAGYGRGILYDVVPGPDGKHRLHTNAASVTLAYIFRPDARAFPPFFDRCLIAHLMAAFYVPLADEDVGLTRSLALLKLAEEESETAKRIDSQQGYPRISN